MNNKPSIKKEVGIDVILRSSHMISFYSTQDAASNFTEYGDLEKRGNNYYLLIVDARFNFDEVVNYIKNYE